MGTSSTVSYVLLLHIMLTFFTTVRRFDKYEIAQGSGVLMSY